MSGYKSPLEFPVLEITRNRIEFTRNAGDGQINVTLFFFPLESKIFLAHYLQHAHTHPQAVAHRNSSVARKRQKNKNHRILQQHVAHAPQSASLSVSHTHSWTPRDTGDWRTA